MVMLKQCMVSLIDGVAIVIQFTSNESTEAVSFAQLDILKGIGNQYRYKHFV